MFETCSSTNKKSWISWKKDGYAMQWTAQITWSNRWKWFGSCTNGGLNTWRNLYVCSFLLLSWYDKFCNFVCNSGWKWVGSLFTKRAFLRTDVWLRLESIKICRKKISSWHWKPVWSLNKDLYVGESDNCRWADRKRMSWLVLYYHRM